MLYPIGRINYLTPEVATPRYGFLNSAPVAQLPYANYGYFPSIVAPQPYPYGYGYGYGSTAMLGWMAGWGLTSLLSTMMWGGYGGWGYGMPFMSPWMMPFGGFGGLGYGLGYGFGSGIWSPWPTWDNWNGGFNWPGPF